MTKALVKYNENIARTILEKVMSGATLRSLCREKGMPSESVLRAWRAKYPEFGQAVHMAREEQAHSLFEEAIDDARDLADNPGTSQRVNATRVKISTLHFAASKLLPKEYGDRQLPSAQIQVNINSSLPLTKGEKIEEGSQTHTLSLTAEIPLEEELLDKTEEKKRRVALRKARKAQPKAVEDKVTQGI